MEEDVRWLGANVALNRYKNVKIFKLALGDYNGKISINVAEGKQSLWCYHKFGSKIPEKGCG